MYVCICNNVTETDIKEAVSAGASSFGCLKRQLGVSTCCGQCAERASGYLKTVLPRAARMSSQNAQAQL
jgi:bacterioferritin-associated ferredoxin